MAGYAPPNEQKFGSPAPRKDNTLKIVLIVLGVLFLIGLLICGGLIVAAYYFAANAKGMITEGVRSAVVQTIRESDLRQEDKDVMVAQVNRVADEYKAGRITIEDLTRIMENMAESPLMVLGMVYVMDEKYIKPADMPESEKEAARLTLQRAARGVYEQKIDQQQIESAIDPISTKDAQGNRQLKDRVTTQELRAVLTELKRLADEAQVPDEPFQVDIGGEFKKAVDRALRIEAERDDS
jgi:hypothetical protein